MKVIAGYYLPTWHETEIEIDDKFSIFETNDNENHSKVINENSELYDEMIEEVTDKLDNNVETSRNWFALRNWAWNIVSAKNDNIVLAENQRIRIINN